jgi:DNA polymerase (family 10)
MPAVNNEIADIFDRLAMLLEIENANRFRVRAYRNAARTIRTMPQSLPEMLENGADLSKLPTIGKDLALKIKEIVETGELSILVETEKKTPGSLADLLKLPGLGPKRIQVLYERLGIKNFEDLRKAVQLGRLSTIPGFGAKIQQQLSEALVKHREQDRRVLLVTAEQIGEHIKQYLKANRNVMNVVIAGSYRRRKETVGDLDIVVASDKHVSVINHFTKYTNVAQVLSKGKTRSTILLHSGIQVDLRVVSARSFGAALIYFTGSKAHNISLRKLAQKNGLKLNEYGIFKGSKPMDCSTEESIYAHLGLAFIEPELRENIGEIKAAKSRTLPKLVTLEDIRGDLQCHTKASDGTNTIEEMTEAAKARGYFYLAISEHTKSLKIAHGLDAKQLAHQIEQIDRLNEKNVGIRILKSAEVEILEDGSLDLPNEILKALDLTVGAIHSKFGLSASAQTDRIIRAMDNTYFNILAHPTGRLLGQREPYPLDMERLMQAALDRGCFLELNAQPERLDLTDYHCKMAKEMGLKLAISTDAHSDQSLEFMRFGIGQARRGWLEADDIINTRTWPKLKNLLDRS